MNPKSPNRNKFKRWICPPGLWEDMDGAAHFDIVAMLRQAGCPEDQITPEEIKETGEMMERVLREIHPEIKLIHRHSPED